MPTLFPFLLSIGILCGLVFLAIKLKAKPLKILFWIIASGFVLALTIYLLLVFVVGPGQKAL
jgi:hypothetical protein